MDTVVVDGANRVKPVGFGGPLALIQALILFLTLLLASAASATTIDFNDLVNGQAGGLSAPGVGGFVFNSDAGSVTFSSHDGNGVAAFDTTVGGPNDPGADPDLLVDSGIALIIQASRNPHVNSAQSTPGIFDNPNDYAQGGVITAVFSNAVTVLSLDVLDINGNGPVDVILTDGNGLTRTYGLPMEFTGDPSPPANFPGIVTLDLTSLSPQVGVGPGTPSSTVSEDAGFDASDVRRLDYSLTGSGALDNLVFVPEPSTALLLGLGLTALAGRRHVA